MSNESELVDQIFACPVCHNNIMDNLVCDEDEVKCTRCGTKYNPQNPIDHKINWRSYIWYRLKYHGDRF